MHQSRACICCGISPPKTYVARGEYTCKPCKQYFGALAPSHFEVRDVVGGGTYATAETTRMGTSAERAFVEYCQAAQYPVRPATMYENTVLHYDYVVHTPTPSQHYHRVEVKSIKSRRRGLPPDPRVIFIELKDIHGNPGWLYGKADLIAFQQPDGFLFVPRGPLVNLVESYLRTFRIVLQSGIHHTLYSRPNRHDLMMVLDIDDIAHLASEKMTDQVPPHLHPQLHWYAQAHWYAPAHWDVRPQVLPTGRTSLRVRQAHSASTPTKRPSSIGSSVSDPISDDDGY